MNIKNIKKIHSCNFSAELKINPDFKKANLFYRKTLVKLIFIKPQNFKSFLIFFEHPKLILCLILQQTESRKKLNVPSNCFSPASLLI